MKDVVVAENIGLCFGVKRALDIVDNTKGSQVRVLGNLIHNPQTIKRLKQQGVEFISTINGLSEGTIVISAHGAPMNLKSQLEKRGMTVIDATCPLVEKIHTTTLKLEKEGYQILILGDKEHAEVKAIASNLSNPVIISNTEKLPSFADCKVALVSQTTQNGNYFAKLTKELRKVAPTSLVYNTICSATRIRQESAKKTAGEVDIMLVIGGHNSANTVRLYEICRKIVETKHIETAAELNPEWFKDNKKIGVTAGASTPDWITDEVIETIRGY